jgi:hypothetical protein
LPVHICTENSILRYGRRDMSFRFQKQDRFEYKQDVARPRKKNENSRIQK